MLDNDRVGSFTYLDSITSTEGGSHEDVKSRIAKAQGGFTVKKNSLEEQEDKFAYKD